MEEVLRRLADFLYGRIRQDRQVPIADVFGHFDPAESFLVDEAIDMLSRSGLMRITRDGQNAVLVPSGKLAHEKGCVAEICLGVQYITQKYRSAVVQVAVRDRQGRPSGGSGFYAADFPGWIATARHVVDEGYTVLEIRDEHSALVSDHNLDVTLVANEELALIRCPTPLGVNPLRIEWDPEAVRELDEILVAGYPVISLHDPALVLSTGEIASFPTLRGSTKTSLLISRVTQPGFSGGPVINTKGFVVAVVEREYIYATEAGNAVFITATRASGYGPLL